MCNLQARMFAPCTSGCVPLKDQLAKILFICKSGAISYFSGANSMALKNRNEKIRLSVLHIRVVSFGINQCCGERLMQCFRFTSQEKERKGLEVGESQQRK